MALPTDEKSLLQYLETTDFVLESNALPVLQAFLKLDPAAIVERASRAQQLLIQNYIGYGPMANLMMDCLEIIEPKRQNIEKKVVQIAQSLFEVEFLKKSDQDFFKKTEPVWIQQLLSDETAYSEEWRLMFSRLCAESNSIFLSTYVKPLLLKHVNVAVVNFAILDSFTQFNAALLNSLASLKVKASNASLDSFTSLCNQNEVSHQYVGTLFNDCEKVSSLPFNLLSHLTVAYFSETKDVNVLKCDALALKLYRFPDIFNSIVSALRDKILSVDIEKIFNGYFKHFSDEDNELPPIAVLRWPPFFSILLQSLFERPVFYGELPDPEVNDEETDQILSLLALSQLENGNVEAMYLLKDDLYRVVYALSFLYRCLTFSAQDQLPDLREEISHPLASILLQVGIRRLMNKLRFVRSQNYHYSQTVLDWLALCIVRHPHQRECLWNLTREMLDHFSSETQFEIRNQLILLLFVFIQEGYFLVFSNFADRINNNLHSSNVRFFLSELISTFAPPFSSEFKAAIKCIWSCPRVNAIIFSMKGGNENAALKDNLLQFIEQTR